MKRRLRRPDFRDPLASGVDREIAEREVIEVGTAPVLMVADPEIAPALCTIVLFPAMRYLTSFMLMQTSRMPSTRVPAS